MPEKVTVIVLDMLKPVNLIGVSNLAEHCPAGHPALG